MAQLRQGTAHGSLTRALKEMIRSGDYDPSGRLPTEEQLAAIHGVSRQTVRRAYQVLTQEGLVTRVQGRGTFVVPLAPGPGYARTGSSIEDLLTLAAQGDIEVISPLTLSEVTGNVTPLQCEGPLARMVRRHRVDGEVTNLTTITIPEPVFHAVRGHTPSAGGGTGAVLELIEQHWSSPVRGVKQRISAQLCGPDHAKLLECSPGDAILDVDRLYYDDSGMYVEHSRSHYVGERFAYLHELRRTLP